MWSRRAPCLGAPRMPATPRVHWRWGATYDPTVLARLGVMGMGADLEKARAWYRTAESLGSAEAKHRLQLLSQR